MIRSVKPGTKTNVTQVAFYEERNIIFNLIFFFRVRPGMFHHIWKRVLDQIWNSGRIFFPNPIIVLHLLLTTSAMVAWLLDQIFLINVIISWDETLWLGIINMLWLCPIYNNQSLFLVPGFLIINYYFQYEDVCETLYEQQCHTEYETTYEQKCETK